MKRNLTGVKAMAEVLCGIVLLAVGYLAGTRRCGKPPEIEMTEDERAESLKAQWDALRGYGGRKPNGR